jgi:hypothetical protein
MPWWGGGGRQSVILPGSTRWARRLRGRAVCLLPPWRLGLAHTRSCRCIRICMYIHGRDLVGCCPGVSCTRSCTIGSVSFLVEKGRTHMQAPSSKNLGAIQGAAGAGRRCPGLAGRLASCHGVWQVCSCIHMHIDNVGSQDRDLRQRSTARGTAGGGRNHVAHDAMLNPVVRSLDAQISGLALCCDPLGGN